jgi:N6-L-threonylcarbamoyladenine synthase
LTINKKNKLILAIETSCDETAASVLEVHFEGKTQKGFSPSNSAKASSPFQGFKIKTLSSVVKSQINLHSKMGGVVPEAAARAHVKYIRPVVEKAINNSLSAEALAKGEQLTINNLDYIAVTQGPGLLPSLMVGVEFAKALSYAGNIAMIPVNHMAGHLYSPFGAISNNEYPNIFPIVSLIVSGGHTMIVLMTDTKNYKVLGQTVDDAAGEAFDKVAKMLKLPYPGGPEVSKLAADGNPEAINFPRPMLNTKDYNFSFSGLKTAVLYYLRDNPQASKTQNLKADICAAFQKAAVDVLVTKTMRAVKEFGAKSVSLSGGVAANKSLRKALIVNCKLLNVKFMVPPINLCTDNAEMIGLAAAFKLLNGFKPVKYNKIQADPNLNL